MSSVISRRKSVKKKTARRLGCLPSDLTWLHGFLCRVGTTHPVVAVELSKGGPSRGRPTGRGR